MSKICNATGLAALTAQRLALKLKVRLYTSVYHTADTLFGDLSSHCFRSPSAVQAADTSDAIREFNASCQHTKTAEAELAKLEKRGIKTPYQAVHPLTGALLPIWIANFVVSDYGGHVGAWS